MSIEYRQIKWDKEDGEKHILNYRFNTDDGEPGIQVQDDEGDWVYVCYLNKEGKLQLCDIVCDQLQLDEHGYIEVER